MHPQIDTYAHHLYGGTPKIIHENELDIPQLSNE